MRYLRDDLPCALHRIAIVGLTLVCTVATAQTPIDPIIGPTYRFPAPALKARGYSVSETITIQLGSPVYATEAVSPVSVVPGGRVRLVVATADTRALRFQWRKNGVALVTVTPYLELENVLEGDSGVYDARVVADDSPPVTTTPVLLRVESQQGARFINFSTLSRIDNAQQNIVAGFVVGANPGQSSDEKLVVIRALGRSLQLFGISDGARFPEIRLFDARGRSFGVFGRLGRMPDFMRLPEIPYTSSATIPSLVEGGDSVLAAWLPAGAYTTVVSSRGGTGAILVEIYEVPYETLAPQLEP